MTVWGGMWAAIEATLTMAKPACASGRNASLIFTVPTALTRMIRSAEPMLGLRPAVWITEATGPTADDVSTSSATDFWSVMSQTTAVHSTSASPERRDRSIQSILTDVADDHGVIASDDLRGGKPHPARATGDDRDVRHRWRPMRRGCPSP